MSCAAHQREIDKDAPRRRLHALVLRLKDCRCPFCGEREIYVHPPNQYHTWWVVGCESTRCESVWRMGPNTGEEALAMLKRSESFTKNVQSPPTGGKEV